MKSKDLNISLVSYKCLVMTNTVHGYTFNCNTELF